MSPLRRHRWAIAAAVLLGAATLLLSFGPGEPRARARASVEFPTYMRHEERERMETRATLELPAPAAPAPEGEPPAPERRDPLMTALPVRSGDPVVVFEANALRHSRLGELFVSCIRSDDPDAFSELERETGVDVLKDVDRVAIVGETVVVSGFFDRLRWDELVQKERLAVQRYGDAGRLFSQQDGHGPTLGAWRDQLLVVGDDAAAVRLALDQLEGRSPPPEATVPEELAYGEVYGVLPGSLARKLLGGADAALAERLAAAASRIELHVDAMQDVAAVVRVRGDDAAGLSDLAKSMGAALAVARVHAQATGDRELSDLLEFARVVPAGGTFSVELALPADRLERLFEGCDNH